MTKRTVFLYLFFTLSFTFAISFIAATYVLFLESHGLNFTQRGIVNAVFYATLVIFEIPTGVFADIFGRKVSCVISYFLLSASMFAYSVSNSFWEFVAAEIICAIGATFFSGAFRAWMIDRLNHHGETKDLNVIFKKEAQISQLAMGVGALLGAYLADKNNAFPWIAGSVLFLISGILAIFLIREEYFEKDKNSIKGIVRITKKAIKQGFGNNIFRFMIIMGLAQTFAVQAPNMQWQPYFFGSLTQIELGYFFFLIAIFGAIGSSASLWIMKKIKISERKFLLFSQLLIGIGIFCIGVSNAVFVSLSIFLFHSIARGLFTPVGDGYLNKSIPEEASKERATILSIERMSCNLAGVAGLILSGLLADHTSIPTTWYVFGGFLVVATLFISKIGKK